MQLAAAAAEQDASDAIPYINKACSITPAGQMVTCCPFRLQMACCISEDTLLLTFLAHAMEMRCWREGRLVHFSKSVHFELIQCHMTAKLEEWWRPSVALLACLRHISS